MLLLSNCIQLNAATLSRSLKCTPPLLHTCTNPLPSPSFLYWIFFESKSKTWQIAGYLHHTGIILEYLPWSIKHNKGFHRKQWQCVKRMELVSKMIIISSERIINNLNPHTLQSISMCTTMSININRRSARLLLEIGIVHLSDVQTSHIFYHYPNSSLPYLSNIQTKRLTAWNWINIIPIIFENGSPQEMNRKNRFKVTLLYYPQDCEFSTYNVSIKNQTNTQSQLSNQVAIDCYFQLDTRARKYVVIACTILGYHSDGKRVPTSRHINGEEWRVWMF